MLPWVKTRQIQGTYCKAKKHKRNRTFRNININLKVLPIFDLDPWCCLGKADGDYYVCIILWGAGGVGFF